MSGGVRALSRHLAPYALNLGCLLFMALYLFVWYMDYPFVFPNDSSAAIWLMALMALLAATPKRLWPWAWLAYMLIAFVLLYINHEKASAMGFPLTEQDFVIAASNPVGLFDALGIVPMQQYALLLVVVFFLLGGTLYLRKSIRRVPRSILMAHSSLAVIALTGFAAFYIAFGEHIYLDRERLIGNSQRWWNKPENLVAASNRLGVLGFLAYTGAERARKPSLLEFAEESAGLPEIDASMLEELTVSVLGKREPWSGLQPNIVFVLAESTFDPTVAFDMEGKRNRLFQNESGRKGGFLHVSAVGGGTWITEFETITGLDARLFGAMGDYTHLTLAPLISHSFPKHLANQGYSTGAFYPVHGAFYGARSAYKNYGFDLFMDGHELELEPDWRKFSDVRMIERIVQELPDDKDKPFFRYVVLLENHSPHDCVSHPEHNSHIKFRKAGSSQDNCTLREYVRRLESTQSGYEKLLSRLQQIEKKTGRPYVAVIFGDHQPHSLTNNRFSGYRTALSPHYTFYQMAASAGIDLPSIGDTFHSSILPTVVSSIVARKAEDIFLPENLLLLKSCGDLARVSDCPQIGRMRNVYKRYVRL